MPRVMPEHKLGDKYSINNYKLALLRVNVRIFFVVLSRYGNMAFRLTEEQHAFLPL